MGIVEEEIIAFMIDFSILCIQEQMKRDPHEFLIIQKEVLQQFFYVATKLYLLMNKIDKKQRMFILQHKSNANKSIITNNNRILPTVALITEMELFHTDSYPLYRDHSKYDLLFYREFSYVG